MILMGKKDNSFSGRLKQLLYIRMDYDKEMHNEVIQSKGRPKEKGLHK